LGPIGEVDRFGENRLYRAWPGIVDEPLNGHVGAEALLEPSPSLPRQSVRDHCLSVRDIREVADAQDRLREQ
jgi:hypothetical protein